MKKYLFILTAALMFFVCACTEAPEDDPPGIPHQIYFLDRHRARWRRIAAPNRVS